MNIGGENMKHIKTLNTQTLNNTVKKAAAENARHPVSLHARLPAQWETRPANIRSNIFATGNRI